MLPVYVINLDRRPDRWEAMAAQLDRLGIEAVRISAVDKETLAGEPALRKLGGGHVACARSHYRAMQAFVDSRAPATLILEDDAEVGESVRALIESPQWWPGEYGLVQLESARKPDMRLRLGAPVGATPDGRALRPIVRKHVGGCGYLIDYDAALQVLEIAPAVPMPIDHLLFDLRNSRLALSLRPLQMTPGPVRHLPRGMFGSETGESRVNGRRVWRSSPVLRAWLILAARVRALASGPARHMAVEYRS